MKIIIEIKGNKAILTADVNGTKLTFEQVRNNDAEKIIYGSNEVYEGNMTENEYNALDNIDLYGLIDTFGSRSE